MSARSVVRFVVAVVFPLFALGCGAKGVAVKGQVVKDGTPYTVPEGDELLVGLIGTTEGTKTFGVTANGADGTFDLGAGGEKVPAGTYKITVTHGKYADTAENDKLKGEFGPDNTPLTVTIPDKDTKLVIDLGAKTATAQ
jgi:hypothetical protein